jgi:hypothetical protein
MNQSSSLGSEQDVAKRSGPLAPSAQPLLRKPARTPDDRIIVSFYRSRSAETPAVLGPVYAAPLGGTSRTQPAWRELVFSVSYWAATARPLEPYRWTRRALSEVQTRQGEDVCDHLSLMRTLGQLESPWTPARSCWFSSPTVGETELVHFFPRLDWRMFSSAPEAEPTRLESEETRAETLGGGGFPQVVRQLFAAGDIRGARKLLDAVVPESLHPDLKRLRAVIRSPRVTRQSKTFASRGAEFNWLKVNGNAYRGRWVALQDDTLIAHASTMRELLDIVGKVAPDAKPLVHHID